MTEMLECYRLEIRRARIPHKCCECDGVITKGETYHLHHGVSEGEWWNFKVCLDCDALRADMDKDVPRDEVTAFGCIWENVCDSQPQHPEWLVRFRDILTKRGVNIPAWMMKGAKK